MRPKVDLEPFLDALRQKRADGETYDELAAWLQEEHNIVCDTSTIRRRFTDAGSGVADLDPYFDEIARQREEGVPFVDIVDNLVNQYGIKTSVRTLRRRCQQWGLPSTSVHLNEEEEETIRDKIEVYVTRDCHTDQEALRHLLKDGHRVTLWHVQRLRKNLGYRRWRRQAVNQELQEFIEQIIRDGLDYAGLRSYGRNFVYTWLRRHRHMYAR